MYAYFTSLALKICTLNNGCIKKITSMPLNLNTNCTCTSAFVHKIFIFGSRGTSNTGIKQELKRQAFFSFLNTHKLVHLHLLQTFL